MISQGQVRLQILLLVGNDEGMAVADTVSQHGIDEFGHALVAKLSSHLDRLVTGRRFRHLVHAKNLIQAQADDGQADRVELVQFARTELGNDPVQIVETAQGPIHQFRIKSPVPVRKFMGLYRLRDDDIAIPFIPANGQQALKGNFTYVHESS